MQKHYVLYTIGYEGRNVEEFVSRLKQFSITRLIDVREIPLSRKKGFSKTVLQMRLNDEGIEYVHFKELGSPKDIRHKLKSDWDYDDFFEKFNAYMEKKEDIIENVYRYLSEGINCLMCFERLPEQCHRSCVASRIKKFDGNGLLIKDI